MSYKRIAIIGISASGKTTLTSKIGEATKLPVTYMDSIYFTGNWQEVAKEVYLAEHEKLITKDKWIIEGYIDQDMKERINRAELVIYLDYSAALCSYRLLKRYWKYRKTSRPELPDESVDKFSWSFFKVVFFRKERIMIESVLANTTAKQLIRCKNPKHCHKELREIFPDSI